VTGVNLYSPSVFKGPLDIGMLNGRVFSQIVRKGKWLVLSFTKSRNHIVHLVSHLAMWGSWTYNLLNKHERVRIIFDTEDMISYNDMRNWGRMYLFNSHHPISYLGALGYDPLNDKQFITDKWLYESLQNRSSMSIVEAIVDQTMICGLGNYMRSEILYRAMIHPLRKCRTITVEECNNIISKMHSVIGASLHNRGTTLSDFYDADGNPGGYQDFLTVYAKAGQL